MIKNLSLVLLLSMIAVNLSAQNDAETDKGEARQPTTIQLGEGDGKVSVSLTLKALGSNEPRKGFKLLAVAKTAERESLKTTGFTDDKGILQIDLKQPFESLRVFAFGEFVIPDAWSNIPLKGEAVDWTAFVRPLQDVKVTGKVTIENGTQARRSYVYFAPLDVKSDNSRQVFDSPYTSYIGEDGSYEIIMPTGYYQVWCTYHDRSNDTPRSFFKIIHQLDLFAPQSLDLTLAESATIEGKVVDARTGKGVSARIDAYSNRYLKRVHLGTADGEFADEIGPDGEEVFHPVGTFKISMYGLDPDDFMVVIRPSKQNNVIRTITGLSLAKLQESEIVWELYTEESSKVEVTVQTTGSKIPVYEIPIGFVPVKIDIPVHLKGEYGANGLTNEDGTVKMQGLMPGTYEVYGAQVFMLGTIEVKPGTDVQKFDFELALPHVTGQVKLPDGTVCTNLLAEIKIVDRGVYPSYTSPWRRNKKLQKQGKIFMPLQALKIKIEVRFMAMKDGAEFAEDDWMNHKDFPLITDKVTLEIDTEIAHTVDLTLKPNPDFKKEEK
ncbi:hypothetical protein OAU50_04005 [Planctomycetota bacterium]|nr:hypothetical protein [Planctomycetota bacterium]